MSRPRVIVLTDAPDVARRIAQVLKGTGRTRVLVVPPPRLEPLAAIAANESRESVADPDDGHERLDDQLRMALVQLAPGAGLTAAEVLVALHAVRGCSNKEIGQLLGTSPATVRTQLSSVCRKLDVDTRGQLAYRVFHQSFASDEPPGAPLGAQRLGPRATNRSG